MLYEKNNIWKFLYNECKAQEKILNEKINYLEDIVSQLKLTRNFIIMLQGFFRKEEKTPESEILEITGGEPMRFRGITIHKHKTCKTWYARYRANGKQYYVSAKTQQECYNKLKLELKNLEQKKLKQLKESKSKEPTKNKSNSITFIEWYEKWKELYKSKVQRTTLKDYSNSLSHLDKLKQVPMKNINVIMILEILNEIKFDRRKQKVYELLNDIFNKAVINEIIDYNPIEKIDKPKHKKISWESFSNEDEIKLEKLLKEKNEDFFLLCLYQGLRKGEALALEVSDIDFKRKTISITKSLNEWGEIDKTKNTYSIRTIPLFDNTFTLLEKYKNETGRIFKNHNHTTTQKIFKELMNDNFPNKKYAIHSLRHTFITRCQEARIPLHIIQKWVGHNIGSKVTSEIYTHTREVAELENIEIYNKKLNSNWTH